MAFTNYHTVNGRLMAESAGGARQGYLLDALGSVTGALDAAGTVLTKFIYEAFGTSHQAQDCFAVVKP